MTASFMEIPELWMWISFKRRLEETDVCFDMDSTLIQTEVIDEADLAGVESKVSHYRRR
jgi:hypothetical protein